MSEPMERREPDAALGTAPGRGGAGPAVERLSRRLLDARSTWPAGLECGPRAAYPERVMQFGGGVFLRAFADWMIDAMNGQGRFGGQVVVVQGTQSGRAAVLNAQDGLFTVWLRGRQGGRDIERRRLVTAVSRALHPVVAWGETVDCFCRAEMRFVVSNTTEAGLDDRQEAYRPGVCPESFPARVAALLHERFRACGGDPGGGVVFLPCELVDENGAILRRAVLQHAARWGFARGFGAWVESSCPFLNTLVDRIVPGHPAAEIDRLTAELGYADALLTAGELYHLWVIEAPDRWERELPLRQAGLNVVWTDRLEPYRTRKVRLLNGAHTAGFATAYLAGLDTVREMVEDPVVGAFLRGVVEEEIGPTVPVDTAEGREYVATVFERLASPFLRHELLPIALNAVAKWRVRVLPSLLDSARLRGGLPRRLVFSLAALIRFYRGTVAPEARDAFLGERDRVGYPIRDGAEVGAGMAGAWAAFCVHGAWDRLAAEVLGNRRFWGMDLNTVNGLARQVAADLARIESLGMRTAVARLDG
jgi:tagaturonate reductase